MSIGIPYMGSKRKLSKRIIDYILYSNPNCKYIYDLFGGGGAISFEALKRPQIKQVYYNELNTGVVELLKKIQKDGVTPEFYEWIDRETFFKLKDGNDWKAGLVKTCWSFGNNQGGYLFGKDIEKYKKLLHEVVVDNNEDSLIELKNLTGLDYAFKVTKISLQNFLFKNKNDLIDNDFKKQMYSSIRNMTIIDQLNRIESLSYITDINSLNISNLSYEQVKINTPIDETIIYLDPPYKNTEKYQNNIDHNKLHNWIINNPYKIYVSSYEWNGLYLCDEYKHRTTLSATANNEVTERLYCNQEERIKQYLF